MKLLTLSSSTELLQHAASWNNLWLRSECAWPTMRAEPLAQWMRTFAAHLPARIHVVEAEGLFLAALPLVKHRLGPLAVGTLPGGDLCSVGDLLWDESASDKRSEDAMRLLVAGTLGGDYSLLRFDAAFPETMRWKAFLKHVERQQGEFLARHRGVTGVIELRGDWDTYFASRSRNHRRHMRVIHNRALAAGNLQLVSVANPAQSEIEQLLRRGFAVEDLSWKGQGGTSTLRTPGAFEFFVEQGRILAASGNLLLTFLVLNGNEIAFEYGWQSKGVYFSLKVGYNEQYQQLSPGQLLRYLMMQKLFREKELFAVDYLGPLSDATAKWTTRTYPVCRLIIARNLWGRLAISLRRRLRGSEVLPPAVSCGESVSVTATDAEKPDAVPVE